MSFTLKDFKTVLEKYESDNPADEYDSGDEHFFAKGGTLPGLGHFNPVESDPSNYWDEGDCWYVIKHEDSGRLFLRTGDYSSYDGYDWDNNGLHEVTKGVEKVKFEAFYDLDNEVVQRSKEIV